MYSPPFLRTPPMHPYHEYRTLDVIHNPEPEVDYFRQIFALQFATSEEAFDCCQRLARKCGFGVRRRTSKSCTVYIVCSREGRPELKKDGIKKRNRTSERCNCDWRVVLFLTDKKVWEFRAGKCMVHNHHLISEEYRAHLDNQTRQQRNLSTPVLLPSNFSQMIVPTPPPSPPKNALEAVQRMQTMPMLSHDIFHAMPHKSHLDSFGHATHPRQMLATPYSQGATQFPYPSDGRNVNSIMFPNPLVDLQMYEPHLFPNTQHLLGLGLYQPTMIPPGQKMFMHSPVNGQQLPQQHDQNDHHVLLQQPPQSMTHNQQLHQQLPPLQLQLQQIQMPSQHQEQQPQTQRVEQQEQKQPQMHYQEQLTQHQEQQEQQQQLPSMLQLHSNLEQFPQTQSQEQLEQLPSVLPLPVAQSDPDELPQTQYQEQQQQLPSLLQLPLLPASQSNLNESPQLPISEPLPLSLLPIEALPKDESE